jgi:hypothetical protein
MRIACTAAVMLVAGLAASASAQVQTINRQSGAFFAPPVNATILANEYNTANGDRYGVAINRTPLGSVNITGSATTGAGGGTGFGGQVGNSQVFMTSSGGTNPMLTVGWLPGTGTGLNDIAVMFLSTRSGGITGANQATDGGDPSRRAITGLLRTNVALPSGFTPDYAIAFSTSGVFLYQIDSFAGGISGASRSAYGFMNGTNTPGLASNNGLSTGSLDQFRELTVPFAALGVALQGPVDFVMGYSGGNGFVANETMPASTTFNAGGNPGFGGGAHWTGFNRFIPTPGAATLLALGGLMAAGRRRA